MVNEPEKIRPCAPVEEVEEELAGVLSRDAGAVMGEVAGRKRG